MLQKSEMDWMRVNDFKISYLIFKTNVTWILHVIINDCCKFKNKSVIFVASLTFIIWLLEIPELSYSHTPDGLTLNCSKPAAWQTPFWVHCIVFKPLVLCMSEFEGREEGEGRRGKSKLAGNRFDLLPDPCQKEGSRKNSLSPQTCYARRVRWIMCKLLFHTMCLVYVFNLKIWKCVLI